MSLDMGLERVKSAVRGLGLKDRLGKLPGVTTDAIYGVLAIRTPDQPGVVSVYMDAFTACEAGADKAVEMPDGRWCRPAVYSFGVDPENLGGRTVEAVVEEAFEVGLVHLGRLIEGGQSAARFVDLYEKAGTVTPVK